MALETFRFFSLCSYFESPTWAAPVASAMIVMAIMSSMSENPRILFFQRKNFRDEHDDEHENREENDFPHLIHECGGHSKKEGEGPYEITDDGFGHSHGHKTVMQMVDTVTLKWIFSRENTGENDVKSIDQVYPESRSDRRDLSSYQKRERGDNEAREHCAGVSESEPWAHAKEPTDKSCGNAYGKDGKNENGVFPEGRSFVHKIKSNGKDSDNDQRDRSQARCESRNAITPIDTIEYENVPSNRKKYRNDKDFESEYGKREPIQIRDASENIGNVADFYACKAYDKSDKDL